MRSSLRRAQVPPAQSPPPAQPTPPTGDGSPAEVFGASLRLGLTSFGGAIAHIGYFRAEYVGRRGWLDDREFADLVALTQMLPGPASSQLGMAIGTQRAGMAGGVAAWLGFTLPSAILMTLFGLVAGGFDLAGAGWVHGLKLAAVAVVAQAVWLMAGSLTPDWPRRIVAIAATAVAILWAVPISQVVIIAVGALVGWLVLRPATDEIPTRNDPRPPGRRVPRRVGIAALAAFVALLIVLPLLAATGDPTIALADTFYRTGSLVFGGGHVVLPLLHASVVDPGWVTDDAFLAGYGAVQAMPGPLFTFAAYLGAVATIPPGGVPADVPGGIPGGVSGAVISLGAIFAPSFLLIFGTLPFWDRLRHATRIRRALRGTNAAVVGLLLAALATTVWPSAVGGVVDVAVVAGAFALLWSGRVPPLLVVALAAVAGQALRTLAIA